MGVGSIMAAAFGSPAIPAQISLKSLLIEAWEAAPATQIQP